jgi:CTP:molybdopterin cytidylyltransferase MocA
VARGKCKIAGKAKFAQIVGKHVNDLFFGQTMNTGQKLTALDEPQNVPGVAAYTITVTNSAQFVDDWGVRYSVTGLPLAKVSSAPVQGQYSVSAGVYTFASADASAAVLISYANRLIERARTLGASSAQHHLMPFRVAPHQWDPDQPMSNSGIHKAWEAVRAAADVPWLRIHDLRHTAITRMAEAGVPIPVILSMAGHISTRMQQHYTAISEFAKRRAVQAAFSAGNYMVSGGRLVGEQQQVAIHRHRRESRGPSKRKSPQFSRGKSGSADSLIPPD